MQPKTAKRKHKRKLKRTPKRRSPIAASLRLKQNRRRVVPSAKHKLSSWSGDTIMRLFEVERF